MSLVLCRRVEESIKIGDDVVVKVTRVQGGQVWLAIDAPRDVRIIRSEIDDLDKKEE